MIGLGLGGWGGLEEKWHGGILPGYVIGECRTTQTELYFGATIDKAYTGLLSGSSNLTLTLNQAKHQPGRSLVHRLRRFVSPSDVSCRFGHVWSD